MGIVKKISKKGCVLTWTHPFFKESAGYQPLVVCLINGLELRIRDGIGNIS